MLTPKIEVQISAIISWMYDLSNHERVYFMNRFKTHFCLNCGRKLDEGQLCYCERED